MLFVAAEARRQASLAFFSKPDAQWQTFLKPRRLSEDRRVSEDRDCKPQPAFMDKTGCAIDLDVLLETAVKIEQDKPIRTQTEPPRARAERRVQDTGDRRIPLKATALKRRRRYTCLHSLAESFKE